MNINKHNANCEMEMDMTPMIDVTFLLIIFFMIITDLTQQDLEDIKLPIAMQSVQDKPEKGVVRPVINLIDTGRMVVKGEEKYDPEKGDLTEIERYLSDQANQMPKEHFNKEAKTGPLIPANPLLIRADQNTEFKHIQRIMTLCGKKGIQIWKLELAASEDPDKVKERKAAEGN